VIDAGDLEALLDSNDPEERRRATSELYVRASDAPLGTCGLVLKALADEDWRVRKEAIATAFALAPSRELLDELVRALQPGENVGLRNAAVEALGGFGVHAVVALDFALVNLDADGRKLAVEALGRVGHELALPVLARMAVDSDPNVRVAAVEAAADLGRAGVSEAIQALEAHLASPEPMLKLAALNGLNSLGVAVPFDTVSALLGEPMLRRAALLAAGRTRNAGAIEPVLDALARATGVLFVELTCAVSELSRERGLVRGIRDNAKRLSAKTNKRVMDLCADEAAFEDARRAAMIAAAALGIEGAAEFAIHTIGDDRFLGEAQEMLELLGELAVPRLVHAIQQRALPERASCLSILGRLAGNTQRGLVVGTALEALEDELADVQREALGIIARYGSAEILVPLSHSLESAASVSTLRQREVALNALAERYPVEARALVDSADPGEPGAHAACVLIAALSPEHAAAERDQVFLSSAAGNASAATRRAALEAMLRVSSVNVLSALSFAVTDEADEVRSVAVSALGRLRDASSRAVGFECLVEILASSADPPLRTSAVRALGNTGDERAVAVLAPLLGNAATLLAVVAVEALATLGASIDTLFGALVHPEPEVVKAGLLAVSERDDSRVPERLAECLAHPAWDVRALSGELLARHPGEVAKSSLRARLSVEQSPAVREVIARSIDRVSGVRRTPPPDLGGSLPPR
jgi:HEAT repeat protein